MSDAPLDTLMRALDARRDAPVRFWFRDDDAVAVTAPLERLLTLPVPLTLAVIPAFARAELAVRLRDVPGVAVAVHGWSHQNHAGAGEKSQELGPHRVATAILAELQRGYDRLHRDFAEGFVPVLVPPWNRIAPQVLAELPGLGFKAVSVFGAERAGPIRQINTHVDLIDWRGTRGGRPLSALVPEILAAMASGVPAIGLLSHHLVHDAAAWDALERLIQVTSRHPGALWVSLPDLVGGRLP